MYDNKSQVETDWLASKPVYHKERTGAASTRFMDVIDRRRIDDRVQGKQVDPLLLSHNLNIESHRYLAARAARLLSR